MKIRRSHRLAATALAGSLLFAACSSDDDDAADEETTETTAAETATGNDSGEETSEPTAEATGDIVEVASGNDDFSTLVSLIESAGLVETLQGDGPFTVFAPTNEAFEKVPAETLEALGNDPEALTAVLTYHVVAGEVTSEQVVELTEATTVNGATVPISVDGDTVMVGDATVTAVDIPATNGVIHVIDTVLLPPGS